MIIVRTSTSSAEGGFQKRTVFCSELSEEYVSDADYERAQLVWKHFNIKNLGDCHGLYVETDVLRLTNVCENSESNV